MPSRAGIGVRVSSSPRTGNLRVAWKVRLGGWSLRSMPCSACHERVRARSSSRPPTQTGKRPGLRGSALWDDPELLHHRQRIEDTPVLAHEAVVAEAHDVDELHVDALAGGRDAYELALVGPGRPHPRDDL